MTADSRAASRKRIAIFNANWVTHPSIRFIASYYKDRGYDVDVFLYDSDETLSAPLHEDEAIKIHRWGRCAPVDARLNYDRQGRAARTAWDWTRAILPSRVRRVILRLLQGIMIRIFPRSGLVPADVVTGIVERARTNPWCLLIGYEKGGLYWASEIGRETGAPVVYHSLEIYSKNDPVVLRETTLRRLAEFESGCHRRCAMTIIQDARRGEALLANNKVDRRMKMAYLPVSLSGNINREPSAWLQSELGLSAADIVILYCGNLFGSRFCSELAGLAQAFPVEWKMIFHGPAGKEAVEEIQKVDQLKKTRVSARLVPAAELENVIRSAHIGVALYRDTSANNILTGFASEKIAMYFKCGIPLVAFRYPTYEHVELERAGVLVERLEDVAGAITTILSDYETFARNAHACYRRHYCFETNFPEIFTELCAIQS